MKKIISLGIVSLAIVGSSFSHAFSDVSSNHWAKSAIDNMVEKKIISGYTDGTFQPSRNLSKIESLILLSKIAGINEYTEAASNFEKEYEKLLSNYKTKYKQQVAYLLGVGVLKEEELPNLVSDDKVNTPITREEMAILVTKILGKEEEVKNKSFVVLSFDDTTAITPEAKPYVEYVYNQSIMKGLTANKFSPKEYVTRAQAAIILNTIISKVDIVPETKQEIVDNTQATVNLTFGKITNIDTVLETIEIDEEDIYEYDEETKIYFKEKLGTIKELKVDMMLSSAKIVDGLINEMKLDAELTDEDEEDEDEKEEKNEEDDEERVEEYEQYYIGEIESATSKKVTIKTENNKNITIYPADEYEVIKAHNAGTMKLNDLDEGDKVIVVGEYDEDDEDYYFTVIIRL